MIRIDKNWQDKEKLFLFIKFESSSPDCGGQCAAIQNLIVCAFTNFVLDHQYLYIRNFAFGKTCKMCRTTKRNI